MLFADFNISLSLGIIYLILLVTLGVISIRKGHWVMFISGSSSRCSG
jgi:hypothetical protein